ncbi:repressor [Edwardsiella hoshinae]|uniref:Repressor n=1 Tax=Edwardsiella hoshinae TaxID=93378 RepID=A0ABM6EL66_9GAMM|nr:PapB/FocB family fimbrial expression transcriptional regulator [Edwardsiella hoshinae]AOV97677.1 repressor [Edwardsiella hoshinae]
MNNSVMKKNRVNGIIGNGDAYLINKKVNLLPGSISEARFWLLIEISPIHSEKVIAALNDYLVLGYTRREACERNNVAAGYFSLSLAKMLRVENVVLLLTTR